MISSIWYFYISYAAVSFSFLFLTWFWILSKSSRIFLSMLSYERWSFSSVVVFGDEFPRFMLETEADLKRCYGLPPRVILELSSSRPFWIVILYLPATDLGLTDLLPAVKPFAFIELPLRGKFLVVPFVVAYSCAIDMLSRGPPTWDKAGIEIALPSSEPPLRIFNMALSLCRFLTLLFWWWLKCSSASAVSSNSLINSSSVLL